MPVTRRKMLSTMMAGLPAVALSAAGATPEPAPSCGLRFFSWNTVFPIRYQDEPIEVSGQIDTWEFSEPTFGKKREIVNPAQPVISSGGISFPVPGEYYLKLNGGEAFLRTCVLQRQEPSFNSIARIFDFTVANMLYSGADDFRWYAADTRQKFVWDWFTGTDPVMLSCGPTHAVFRWLIEDRLGLPTRTVTFPATYYKRGKLVHDTHNVAEIYSPDLDRFVLCDVNNAFLPKWIDAISLSEIVTNSWCDIYSPYDRWEDLQGLSIHKSVDALLPDKDRYNAALRKAKGGRVPFTPDLISNVPTTISRNSWLRCLYGGVAYWGAEVGWARPTGTEFLPGGYQFVNLHKNPVLTREAIKWIQELSGLEVTMRTASEMRQALRDGHRSEIAAARWWGKQK